MLLANGTLSLSEDDVDDVEVANAIDDDDGGDGNASALPSSPVPDSIRRCPSSSPLDDSNTGLTTRLPLDTDNDGLCRAAA